MKNEHKTIRISDLDIPDASNLDLKDFDEHESSLKLTDPQTVKEILMQHFLSGDHETFFEILALYMDHVGKSEISKGTLIPERTIYNFINGQHKTSSENIFKVMKFIAGEAEKASA